MHGWPTAAGIQQEEEMSERAFGRRSFLVGTGGAAVLLGMGSVSGCGTGGAARQANTVASNAKVVLPAYVPYAGITPDLPATAEGVEAAFRHFPKQRPKSVPEKPGNGETINGMSHIYLPVPPGVDRNSYWAGLNDRLGIDLKLQMVPAADYEQKFATTIAGNELPDVMQLRPVSNLPALLDRQFTRLDDYLAGDAIKKYPNLANIPTQHWKATVFNGGIYGIPIPRGAVSVYHFIRQDLFEAAGVSPEPKGLTELTETAKVLTDPKARRWAFGHWNGVQQYLLMMNGAPNGWRAEGGRLVHQFETEEHKQAIADLAQLWSAGIMHPDAFSDQFPAANLFAAGTVAVNFFDGYLGWNTYIQNGASNPDFKLALMPVYTRDGSELASWFRGYVTNVSITGLKKQSDPKKIELILRMLNWLAAPFGTEEYVYRVFGEEGVDHTVNGDGDPTLTQTGLTNTAVPIRYLSDAPAVIYQPGRSQDADVQHAYQTKVLAKSTLNPTVGLFSNTHASKNTAVEKAFTNGVKEIVQGRKPISTLDDLVKTWRSSAGDAMRKEYEGQL
ncbi:extracellular solute-binding protein [Nonomuraea terrae]|uniref:Extracellular solute-binding protein n=1 Tax=Nonomuraea terrae TaxID=2530383 RepID=A0A4R4YJ70_9ACTN|nr:extracellular solute-binding protein [Nonomuraea terrae]TDD44978.1 extracellular solute-binding protein [Nonomuraea terrae]